jgi:uncharacterized RDD family membrane protein YckC
MKKEEIPASIWKRSFAYVIDLLIINILLIYPFQNTLDLKNMSFQETYTYLMNNPTIMYSMLFSSIIVFFLILFYWALLEYYTSQTVGKMIFNIKVISLKNKLTLKQTLIRNLSKFSLPLLILDSLNILMKKKSQRFLEQVSDTLVIINNPEVI